MNWKEITKNIIASRREDLKIAMSIPEIGFTSALTILAEIDESKRLC